MSEQNMVNNVKFQQPEFTDYKDPTVEADIDIKEGKTLTEWVDRWIKDGLEAAKKNDLRHEKLALQYCKEDTTTCYDRLSSRMR